MRPNIEWIKERVNKATPGVWELGREHGESGWSNGLPDGSEVIVSRGTQWALGQDVAAVPFKYSNDGEFIAHARTDIPALLAYIGELESMPLVQTMVKLQEENERLREALEIIASSHVEVEKMYGGIQQPESFEVRIARQALEESK